MKISTREPDERNIRVVYWSLTRLQPYECNPRKNDHAVVPQCMISS